MTPDPDLHLHLGDRARTITASGRQKQLSFDSAVLWIAEHVCADLRAQLHMSSDHPSVVMVAGMFGCKPGDVAGAVMQSFCWRESRKRKARSVRSDI